jgi:hypothetical protein
MALPTFFIIGAAKAGTTSLHYYLDQHPGIQMSAEKEPNFFSGPPNGLPYRFGRVESMGDYEKLFDPRVSVRGEASVGYSNYPRRVGVPERIKESVPDARFVYMVRDPIERTVSQYHHRVAVEGEHRPLREALLSDLSDPYAVYVSPSLYATQMELYLRHFPQERMLVLDQVELQTDRREALRQIFDFLSVDPGVDSERFDEELNTQSDHRLYPSFYARFRGSALPRLSSWIPREVRWPMRRRLEAAFMRPVERSQLDEDTRNRLQERYQAEVERLRELTGKTFSGWSV